MNQWPPWCKPAPVPKLKALFIWRSEIRGENRAMLTPGLHAPTLRLRTLWGALGAALLWGLLGLAPVAARDDHEQAREAVQAGQILPLRQILEALERSHPGRVLEVELERRHDLWMYEVKLLQPDGRLVKLRLDARTGEVLQRRQ